MKNTMLIQLTNQKAAGLLHEMEELQLIKVLKEEPELKSSKLSDKYKGFMNRKDGQDLNDHIERMRNEWDSI
ncbi:MAG: hypothetical protein GVY19_13085 [Bacteroidetes bacterium]|jgi:hypothetical protein|nr:hypothetical protein [Bacteroidota bacterium]